VHAFFKSFGVAFLYAKRSGEGSQVHLLAPYIVSLLVTIGVMNQFQASHVLPFEQLNNSLEHLCCIRLVAMQRLSLGL